MHIDHSPGSQHGLLVGVVEHVMNVGDGLDALFNVHRVGLASPLAVEASGTLEAGHIVAPFETVEFLFRHTARHKFLPWTVIYLAGEVVERNPVIVILREFASEYQQRNAEWDATEYLDAVFFLLASLLTFFFQGFVGLLLFGSAFLRVFFRSLLSGLTLGWSESVLRNILSLGRLLHVGGLADLNTHLIEFIDIALGHGVEDISGVVEGVVVEAIESYALVVHAVKALEEAVDIERHHSAAVKRDDRAKLQEFFDKLLLACFITLLGT